MKDLNSGLTGFHKKAVIGCRQVIGSVGEETPPRMHMKKIRICNRYLAIGRYVRASVHTGFSLFLVMILTFQIKSVNK